MRRNLIKQGAGSYTLTLPKSWVEQHGLVHGTELELVEQGDVLQIAARKVVKEQSKILDLPDPLYHTTLWYFIFSSYVAGYQEIILKPKSSSCILVNRLTYKKSKVPIAKAVQDIMAVVVGMEVLVQTKEKIVIREIASGNPDQFTSTLNRAFYVLETVIEETFSALKEKEQESVLVSFFAGANLHKLHQYCLRLVQQYGYEDASRTIFVARLITSLDEFANRLKDLLQTKKAVGADELVLVLRMKEYLDLARGHLQKKDLHKTALLLQEVKDVRLSLKHKVLKDCYDQINAIIQNIMEIIV